MADDGQAVAQEGGTGPAVVLAGAQFRIVIGGVRNLRLFILELGRGEVDGGYLAAFHHDGALGCERPDITVRSLDHDFQLAVGGGGNGKVEVGEGVGIQGHGRRADQRSAGRAGGDDRCAVRNGVTAAHGFGRIVGIHQRDGGDAARVTLQADADDAAEVVEFKGPRVGFGVHGKSGDIVLHIGLLRGKAARRAKDGGGIKDFISGR